METEPEGQKKKFLRKAQRWLSSRELCKGEETASDESEQILFV